MRKHVRDAVRLARKLGGSATYTPGTPHGRLELTNPDGDVETVVISTTPRNSDQTFRVIAGTIRKFMQGKATSASRAKYTGRDA